MGINNKNLILLTLFAFLSCQNKEDNTLTAQLSLVGDKVYTIINEFKTYNDTIYRRIIGLHYKMINDTSDSIYLPIGYPYNPYVSARIYNQRYAKIIIDEERVWTQKNDCNVHENHYYDINDTIYYSIYLHIDNYIDRKWIKDVPTNEILQGLELIYWPSSNDSTLIGKNVPNIIFCNDTTNVKINPSPIIVPKKRK